MCRYIEQLREGVNNFVVTFIVVLRDRPPGHDWELEPGVTCGDYLFGMLHVGSHSLLHALCCMRLVPISFLYWKVIDGGFLKLLRCFMFLL